MHVCAGAKLRLLIAVAALLFTSGLGHIAMGQDLALAGRAPRFLRPAPSGTNSVEIEAGSSPALRRLVSLDFARPTVGVLLDAIERQTKLKFVFNVARLPADRPVELQAQKITVAAALTAILLDTGLDVLLSSDNHVVLVERTRSAARQTGTILGRVADKATGAGLAGTDVFLDGTRWRTATDSVGHYRLADVDPGAYTLTVRRLGYVKESRKIVVRPGREDTINVALAAAAVPLQELVTTATGQQRRRDLGNAITTIKADSVLRTAPIRNLTDLLQNRVPGLTVQHTTGAPGDPARLRLRGLGSILRSNDPVVVVDGVRIYAAQADVRSGSLTNVLARDRLGNDLTGTAGQSLSRGGVPAPSPLDQIDPNTIETIEVLKGPSAATLYGADAANGVIVITTKRGKPGPTVWNASVQQSITQIPGLWPTGYYRWGRSMFGGGQQFCSLLREDCVQDSLTQFQALNQPSLTVLGRGRLTQLSLGASGGTKALTYSITGSYGEELGLLKLPDFEIERFRTQFNKDAPDWMQRPHHYKDWSVASNVTAQLGPVAEVTLQTMLTGSTQQRTTLEGELTPMATTYVDTVHGIYYRPIDGAATVDYNVLTSTILKNYYVRTTNGTLTFTTGLHANWHPRSWFNAQGQAGLNVMPRDDETLLPAGLVAPTDSGTLIRGTGRSVVSTFSLQGELRKPLAHGFVFTTSVGANVNATSTADLISSASGLVPGTTAIGTARQVTSMDRRVSTSVFGWYLEPRLGGQRFSLSTGVRLDGGSAYGTRITGFGGGGGGFLRGLLALPKLNGSWVVSEEPWFPFHGLFSSLRLRGAYGQAQVQPGPADRLRIYNRLPSATDPRIAGLLAVTGVGNTHLRPERSTEFEGGFDADLLDGRLSVELTGYRKMQVDALMSVPLPSSVNGGGSVITNVGNIRNTGVDVTLGFTPLRTSVVQWNTRLTYSRNRNELVELGRGVDPNPAAGLVAGYPVGSRWAQPILGFADQNGDGVLERREVQVGDSPVYLGRLYPAYQTVLDNNVALFGGSLAITAQFAYDAGRSQVNETAHNMVFSRALVDPNAPLSEQAAVIAFEALRGDDGIIASPSTEYGIVQTVSTFRFATLSVNYRMPSSIAKLLRTQELTMGLHGSNLGLHSTYRGKDPDVNAWGPGEGIVDDGNLPQPRTWQLSVRLRY